MSEIVRRRSARSLQVEVFTLLNKASSVHQVWPGPTNHRKCDVCPEPATTPTGYVSGYVSMTLADVPGNLPVQGAPDRSRQ